MATIKIGFLSDIHHSENANAGDRYYDDALKKAEQAATQFNNDGVSAIFILGDIVDDDEDGQENRVEEVKAEFDNHAGGIDTYWAVGNHDCYSDNYTKTDWLADVDQSSLYYYVDIGNLRVIVLDTCYSDEETSYPEGYSYATAWLSRAQLNWLESTLTAAEAAGKFSMVCCHHDLGAKGGIYTIQNAIQVRNILQRHKVIATVIREKGVMALVRLALDGEGKRRPRRPNTVKYLRTAGVKGYRIRVSWIYWHVGNEVEPDCFEVYGDNGTGVIDYENPLGKVNYDENYYYTLVTEPLTPGTVYRFGVRAFSAAGDHCGSTSWVEGQVNLAAANPVAAWLASLRM
jgi:predicted phosphodiesterase